MRYTVISDFAEITKKDPEKSLLKPVKRTGGRNMYGRVTMRFRGGGHKRMYRMIDFKRNRLDEAAEVIAVEYDPNRTARIALIQYADGQKSYIVAPLEIKVGDKIISTMTKEVDFKAARVSGE